MTYRIIQGDNRHQLKDFPDNHFDSIVTDPPYGIDFLGKAWDANTGALETYQECLRVLKPGGHLLAFSAARTYHHLAITLEQAGFEIRDQIMWIYSSGFPKSQDVGRQLHKKEHGKPDKQRYSKDEMTKEGDNYRHNTNKKLYRILPDINGDRLEKSHEGEGYGYIFEEIIEVNNEWSGWGTALKPAHEPICLARKPTKLSTQQNVQKYGTGALNIDATRIPATDLKEGKMGTTAHDNYNAEKNADEGLRSGEQLPWIPSEQGRFPSNVIGEIPDYQKYFYNPEVSSKPAHEPICLARKPIKVGSVANNVQIHGTGALNIDATRIEWDDEAKERNEKINASGGVKIGIGIERYGNIGGEEQSNGKKVMLNEQGRFPSNVIGEIADGYQKYFYCPKVSRAERHMGFEDPGPLFSGMSRVEVNMGGLTNSSEKNKNNTRGDVEKKSAGNNHPTVKPVELMKYLIKLITPAGGTVLDPFCGSGSTGMAAVELGYAFVGVELDARYCQIASKRITAWNKKGAVYKELFE